MVDSSVGGDWDVWDDDDEFMMNSVLKKKIVKLSKQLKKYGCCPLQDLIVCLLFEDES